MMNRYTVACTPAPRGTAGAASRIPELKLAIQQLGGTVHGTFVVGPYLYADASLTPQMAKTIRAEWHDVESVHRQYGAEVVGS